MGVAIRRGWMHRHVCSKERSVCLFILNNTPPVSTVSTRCPARRSRPILARAQQQDAARDARGLRGREPTRATPSARRSHPPCTMPPPSRRQSRALRTRQWLLYTQRHARVDDMARLRLPPAGAAGPRPCAGSRRWGGALPPRCARARLYK